MKSEDAQLNGRDKEVLGKTTIKHGGGVRGFLTGEVQLHSNANVIRHSREHQRKTIEDPLTG